MTTVGTSLMFKALQVQSWLFFLPALIINILFTGCGALYLQLLAVKPKNKNSKNPVATNFVKKFKHYSYSEEAEG